MATKVPEHEPEDELLDDPHLAEPLSTNFWTRTTVPHRWWAD
jgi:hypothetical protein